MNYFIVLTLTGIAAGMIYSALALALVLIWRATRIVNFAQGAMAMATTYIALAVIQATGSYWLGFAAAIGAGFVIAVVLMVMIALLLLFRFAGLGLSMRAAAFAPEIARMLGVRVGRLLTFGWSLASMAGAL